LCANDTSKIKLGTNVTNPSSRIAPVTACNFATLNALAPGRVVIIGIGTGRDLAAELCYWHTCTVKDHHRFHFPVPANEVERTAKRLLIEMVEQKSKTPIRIVHSE
jgi:hypothetical protein